MKYTSQCIILMLSLFMILLLNGCTQNEYQEKSGSINPQTDILTINQAESKKPENDLFNHASASLLQEISKQLGKQEKDLTVNDLLSITQFSSDGPFDNPVDVEIIGKMENLTDLSLQNIKVQNFDFLLGLTKLEHLTIQHFQTESPLPSFKPLKNLTYLSLNDGGVSDLHFLEGVTSLQTLDISQNQIIDISLISSLNNLVLLNISENPIRHIEPIKNLSKLNRVEMMYLQIDDPESLSQCESLHYLDIRYSNITSIKPLIHLKDLKVLLVSYQEIEDLDLLPETVKVSELPILEY